MNVSSFHPCRALSIVALSIIALAGPGQAAQNSPCKTSAKQPWFCKYDRHPLDLPRTIDRGVEPAVYHEPAGLIDSEFSVFSTVQPESHGYGRYTYVLLAHSPEQAARNHRLLQELVEGTPYLGSLFGITKKQLNLFEIPVAGNRRLTDQTDAARIERTIESRYDYGAARSLLDKVCMSGQVRYSSVCRTSRDVGPYLLTYAHPVGPHSRLTMPYLLIDLSDVDADLLPYYIREMKAQALSPSLTDTGRIYSMKNTILKWMLAYSKQTPAIASAVVQFFKR